MKRKSKGLALLLALMMLISMNPAIVFAEAVGQPGDTPAVAEETPVTPEKVHEELGTAIDAAIALEDYQRLAAAYGPDSENVTKAYAAWQDAEIKARAANKAAEDAAAASGSGYAAASSTSKANTGDNSKTLVWLTTLATAGIALAKGLVGRLRTQN